MFPEFTMSIPITTNDMWITNLFLLVIVERRLCSRLNAFSLMNKMIGLLSHVSFVDYGISNFFGLFSCIFPDIRDLFFLASRPQKEESQHVLFAKPNSHAHTLECLVILPYLIKRSIHKLSPLMHRMRIFTCFPVADLTIMTPG